MIRIVADTNVLISALIWKGKLEKFSDLVNNRQVILCFSPETLAELQRVLTYEHIARKIHEDQIDPESIIDQLIAKSLIVYPKRAVQIITADPSDNRFLECALKARAKAIISGDNHLLQIKEFGRIPILTPAQFLNRY